jgi:signal transduction histidine kinase/FixJ family two-component response regulator/HPt (histidine-containing phosphotransfer) domain-containing protein
MRKLKWSIKSKRLLLSQILFTALAFVLMVVLSYYFTSGIVYSNLTRYAESVISSAQMQFEYDLQEPKNALGSYAQSIRSMVLNGSDVEMVRHYTYDIAAHLHADRAIRAGNEDSMEDLFVYLDADVFPGDVNFGDGDFRIISGFGWVFPDGQDPTERLWYQRAADAGGEIAATAPFESLRSGKTVITFTQCILSDDSGRPLIIAGLNVQIQEIGENIIDIALDRGGYGMIIDPELTIISHANPNFIGLHITDPQLPLMVFVEDMLAGKDIETDTYVNWTGEETVAYIRQLENGWYLGLMTPRGPFYKDANDMLLTLCMLGAMLAAVLIITLIHIDRAKDRAREESKQKSVFLANMSHEIRTPLNAVIGLSDLVLTTDGGLNEESRYRLEQINNAGATLLSTVNDILDISKIEAGKFELIPAKYDIPSMLNDAVTQSIMHKGEKPIEFVMNICENLPAYLCGDELRIKQILNNILSNAFKYTSAGTVELTVESVQDGDDVRMKFIVRDTGIGIRPEDMGNLFNDYVQMDMAANRKVIGTGLGLSIARRLSHLMGGKITVESEHGAGSVFTVQLAQKYVTDEIIGPDVIRNLKNLTYSDQKRRMAGTQTRISLPYARVLIVDDVMTNLDVAKGLMKPYNMQIDCVSSGWESVEAMHNKNIRYNAIFMDHMMPGMDGIEAARLIREIGTDYAKNIPIIALTANAIVGNEEMFLSKGFQAFISKPIEIARLDAVIREWVRDREAEQSHAAIRGQKPAAPATEGSIELKGFTVPGLDIKKGLRRFGGDTDAYLGVLRSYAKNTPPLLDSAAEAGKSKETLTDYETIVHGIKGSSHAIFAEETGDLAGELEQAAHSGDYDFVAANNFAFTETARRLIIDIEKLLGLVSAPQNKPKKDAPDGKLLQKLRGACVNYEMNAADEALEELEAFAYEADGELIVWLRENVEQMNFDEIAERLSE